MAYKSSKTRTDSDRASDRKFYRNNKQRRIADASDRRRAISLALFKYKSTLQCIYCGESHPACLEFHHRDPSNKVGNISEMIPNGYSLDSIMKEIEKCDVLCSNCHAKKEFEKRQNGDVAPNW